jgi:hypothetical protein
VIEFEEHSRLISVGAWLFRQAPVVVAKNVPAVLATSGYFPEGCRIEPPL